MIRNDARVVIPVRGNDSDSAGHSLAVVATSPAGHGTVETLGNGTLRYTLTSPALTDTFTYTIRCANGQVTTATVTITITA